MFKFVLHDMDISHKYDEVPSPDSDKEFNRHYHSFYEIFYFISGTATYTVENEKRLLQPYDGLIIRPGEFHNVEFLDKTPYERYVLKLPAKLMPFMHDKLQSRSAFFPKQQAAFELFNHFDKAYKTYSGDDFYLYAACVAIQAVLCFCNSEEEPPAELNLANAKLMPVLRYINDNITQPLTLTQIADVFQYSPDYLNRAFYRYMKTPLMKYIRAKRMFEAHRMLVSGFKPTQVAERLGFTDYSSFYRSYVSIIGNPPSKDYNDNCSTFISED